MRSQAGAAGRKKQNADCTSTNTSHAIPHWESHRCPLGNVICSKLSPPFTLPMAWQPCKSSIHKFTHDSGSGLFFLIILFVYQDQASTQNLGLCQAMQQHEQAFASKLCGVQTCSRQCHPEGCCLQRRELGHAQGECLRGWCSQGTPGSGSQSQQVTLPLDYQAHNLQNPFNVGDHSFYVFSFFLLGVSSWISFYRRKQGGRVDGELEAKLCLLCAFADLEMLLSI